MRFLVNHNSVKVACADPGKKPEKIPLIPLHRTHNHLGQIEAYDFLWAGSAKYAEQRLPRACALFEIALTEYRKEKIPERVLIQYQETVRAIIRSCSDPRLLLAYSSWQHDRAKYDKYYAGVWAAAWVRLFDVLKEEDLQGLKSVIRDKYLQVAGSRVAGIVSEELKRRNLWNDLAKLIRTH
jgi:hypothetical protein